MSDLILYTSDDGQTRIHLRADAGSVWLTQAEIAELFQTTPQNVTTHIRSIYEHGELTEPATCKDLLQVRSEGERQVQRSLKHYNLDLILAIGYRVSHDAMKQIAHERYDTFDQHRRTAEAAEADAEDLKQLEAIEKQIEEQTDTQG